MRTLSLGAACLLLALLAIILSEAAAIGPFGRKKKNGWRWNKDEASSDAPQPVTCDEVMARTIVGISDEKAEIAAQLQAALSELDAANRNISTLKEVSSSHRGHNSRCRVHPGQTIPCSDCHRHRTIADRLL